MSVNDKHVSALHISHLMYRITDNYSDYSKVSCQNVKCKAVRMLSPDIL
jgi:hypothetical protein